MRLPPPRIAGVGVTLRAIEATDVDAWYAYLSDPEVVKHSSWNLKHPDELRAIVDDAASGETVRYAIVDDATGRLAGTIGLPLVSQVHGTAEVAYDVHPDFAGRGIAGACCRALTDALLREHGFVRVQATALDTNAASIRIIERAGYTFEGVLKNLKKVRGVPRDFRLYAKTAP